MLESQWQEFLLRMNVPAIGGTISSAGFIYPLLGCLLAACFGTFGAPTVQTKWQMKRYASISSQNAKSWVVGTK